MALGQNKLMPNLFCWSLYSMLLRVNRLAFGCFEHDCSLQWPGYWTLPVANNVNVITLSAACTFWYKSNKSSLLSSRGDYKHLMREGVIADSTIKKHWDLTWMPQCGMNIDNVKTRRTFEVTIKLKFLSECTRTTDAFLYITRVYWMRQDTVN